MNIVKTPTIPRPSDSLEELNNLITEKCDKWDTFDFNVTKKRLNAIKKIVINRELEWSDPDLQIDDVVTIVIGKQGADFEDHEKRR